MKHDDVNLKSYYITTNNDYILEIICGNMVTSTDQFKVNAVFIEAVSEGTYGDWNYSTLKMFSFHVTNISTTCWLKLRALKLNQSM